MSGHASSREGPGRDIRGHVDEYTAELDLDKGHEEVWKNQGRGGPKQNLRGHVDLKYRWIHQGTRRRGRQGATTRMD